MEVEGLAGQLQLCHSVAFCFERTISTFALPVDLALPLMDKGVTAGVAEHDIVFTYSRFLLVEIYLINEFSRLASLESVNDTVSVPETPAFCALFVQPRLLLIEVDEPSDESLACFHRHITI